MTTSNDRPGSTAGNANAAGHDKDKASGKHQGLHQPADDRRVEDALDNVGLDDRGAVMEDHLRDRRSKGMAGAYDDSIDHDLADRDGAQ